MYSTVFWIAIPLTLSFFLMKKNINIGLIMLSNCFFIAIITKMPFDSISLATTQGAFSKKTISLISLLVIIMMVENIMRNSGMIKQMTDSLKLIISNKYILAVVMPFVLGLLPSPGGARFSCPMVDEILETNSSNETKAFINFWFRHVWMDAFILYPGIIIASELLDVSVLYFFSHMLVFITFTFLVGLISIKGKIKISKIDNIENKGPHIKAFLVSVFPIILMICLYIILLNFISSALLVAGSITIVFLSIYKKLSLKKLFTTFKESINPKYILIISGVMVFIQFLSTSGLINELIKLIVLYKFPKEILFLLLPFVASLASGITVSYVSLTFPILIPLGLNENIWYACIAYSAGYVGSCITPLHLCIVMTSDYFKISLNKLISKLSLSIFAVALFIIGFLYLL